MLDDVLVAILKIVGCALAVGLVGLWLWMLFDLGLTSWRWGERK